MNTAFTTAELRQDRDDDSVFLHPNFPQHIIKATIPSSVAVFVHLSRSVASDAVRDAITKCLTTSCLKISEEGILGHEVNASSKPETVITLAQMLQKASDDPQTVACEIECIQLENAIHHKGIGEPLAVVDWTASPLVTAKVQPVDSGMLFRADCTYLFVGMAGELGQSLAEWMIKHGARNVVLTSRTPRVNPRFAEDMEKLYGASVIAMSLDVTSRQSLENVLNAITATLPPISGIINGAMVLEDGLFANMTLENFTRVTAPKMLGTQLLDQAFHDDTSLDFFIVTSSIASIIGWTGQSNYSAANEGMSSVVCKRRARGVPASIMNIPAVLGVGYAAHADNFDFDYFESIGCINICEEDLPTLFAEAVLSGRPGQTSEVQAQVIMGVNFIPADLEVKAAHKRDVKFCHFVQREEKSAEAQAVKTSVRVKVQLQTARSQEEAFAITRDAFLAHLKCLLRIIEKENLDDSVSLMDQGVDSLVAVDIRAWFLIELGVDVPTLKILGGGSIADLIRGALSGASLKHDENNLAPQPTALSIPILRIVPSASDESGSSSGSRTPDFTPAPYSRASVSTTPPTEEFLNKLEDRTRDLKGSSGIGS